MRSALCGSKGTAAPTMIFGCKAARPRSMRETPLLLPVRASAQRRPDQSGTYGQYAAGDAQSPRSRASPGPQRPGEIRAGTDRCRQLAGQRPGQGTRGGPDQRRTQHSDRQLGSPTASRRLGFREVPIYAGEHQRGDRSAPQNVYQAYITTSHGVGNKLAWSLPVPDGAYKLRLHFMEPHATAGQRNSTFWSTANSCKTIMKSSWPRGASTVRWCSTCRSQPRADRD